MFYFLPFSLVLVFLTLSPWVAPRFLSEEDNPGAGNVRALSPGFQTPLKKIHITLISFKPNVDNIVKNLSAAYDKYFSTLRIRAPCI
jgi:hypothetical protein